MEDNEIPMPGDEQTERDDPFSLESRENYAKEAWQDAAEEQGDEAGYGFTKGVEQFQSRLLEKVDKRIAELKMGTPEENQINELKYFRNLILTVTPSKKEDHHP